MAHTATNLVRVKTGNRTLVFGKFVFDTVFDTGGEAVVPASLGLSKIDSIVCTDACTDAGTTGFGIAAVSADETAWRLTSNVAHATPGATVAGIELTTDDLSTFHCRFVACGY